MYLLSEIQKVYRSQGQNIHDKHFEVIIRKMMSKVSISRAGDSKHLPGDAVDRQELRKMNEQLLSDGKQTAKVQDLLLGVTKASLSTDSWLSASSFQHTIKVLAAPSVRQPIRCQPKENVIIGKLLMPVLASCPDGCAEEGEGASSSGRRSANLRRTNIPACDHQEKTGTSSENCRSHTGVLPRLGIQLGPRKPYGEALHQPSGALH
jgi:hypothetical protein